MMVVIFCICALFIGSLMNDVIDYFINKEQGKAQLFQCEFCHHPLKWYDKLPVISYLISQGKCRYCKKKISARYPLVEIGAVVNFMCIYQLYKDDIQGLYLFVFLCVLLLLSVIDMMLMKVPTRLLLLCGVLGVLTALTTNHLILLDRICAIFIVSVPLFIINRIKKHSIGEADIIFSACAGFLLGMWGIVFSICFAYILAGIYAVIMLCLHKLKKQDRIAMFPFFYLAIVTYLLYALDFIHITLR